MTNRFVASDLAGIEEYNRLVRLLEERRFEEARARGRLLLEQPETRARVRAQAHNLLCWIFIEGLKQAAPEAVLHGEEAVLLAGKLGDPELIAAALCNLASARYAMGSYAQSGAAYQQLLERLQSSPGCLPSGAIIALQGLAQIHLVRGDGTEALRLLTEAAEQCRQEHCAALLAEVYRRTALVLISLGQADEASAVLAMAADEAFGQSSRSLWWKTHLCFTRARLELAMGHWATARMLAANTLALARELGDLPVAAEATCLLAEVDQAEGRREAPRRARQALACAIHSGRRDVVDDVRQRLKSLLSFEV